MTACDHDIDPGGFSVYPPGGCGLFPGLSPIFMCRNAGPVGAAIDSQRYGTVIDGPEDVTASLGYWPPSCDDAALFSRQINTQLELFSIQ